MKRKSGNAILGIAFNYNDHKLFPFLKSLEKTGFKGELILFINNNTSLSEVIKYQYNVTYVNIEKKLSFAGVIQKGMSGLLHMLNVQNWWIRLHRKKIRATLKKKQPLSGWMLAFFHHNFYLATARFAYYYNWLVKGNYDQVFFTDVNDVFFQGDIFAVTDPAKVLAFEEYGDIKLGNDNNNSSWVEAGYGSGVLDEIYDSTIYCSGTILGNTNVCLTFLSDFLQELLTGRKPAWMVGFDQGIFNYMVSYERKNYFRPSKNGDIVFTVATQPEAEIAINDNSVVLKGSAHVPAVVHQYNRHPKLVGFIQDKFM